MYKKFLWISAALAFWGTNNAIGMDDESTPISTHVQAKVIVNDTAPGESAWKDKFGQVAPARVRSAADQLWDNVKREGEAALNANWGIECDSPTETTECARQGCLLICCTCGLSLVCCSEDKPKNKNPSFQQYEGPAPAGAHVIWEERKAEVNKSVKEFKTAVNESVKQPINYSGDADFCTLGPWIRDGAFTKKAAGGSAVSYQRPPIESGRQDLSAIPASTMKFVNEHGGWTITTGK